MWTGKKKHLFFLQKESLWNSDDKWEEFRNDPNWTAAKTKNTEECYIRNKNLFDASLAFCHICVPPTNRLISFI